ncbi:MAG: class I SAM-dependent methyltransferase [Promethearchaeota archaeon]
MINLIKSFQRYIIPTISSAKFDILFRLINGKSVRVLDVGCGNHSAQSTKKIFPHCKYFGLDKSLDYNNTEEDFKLMEKFWLINLDESDFIEIPNAFFDVIIFSHVIEHLKRGERVIHKLATKLKSNGLFYIEFPSYHTKSLPSLKRFGATFNFYDDITHIKLYKKKNIVQVLKNENFKIKKAKIYFNWKKLIFLPVLLAYQFSKQRLKCFHQLWWIVGWCTYIVAYKT